MKISLHQSELIQFRPGKQNGNADSLSCNLVQNTSSDNQELSALETAVNLWINSNVLEELKLQQKTDPKL